MYEGICCVANDTTIQFSNHVMYYGKPGRPHRANELRNLHAFDEVELNGCVSSENCPAHDTSMLGGS